MKSFALFQLEYHEYDQNLRINRAIRTDSGMASAFFTAWECSLAFVVGYLALSGSLYIRRSGRAPFDVSHCLGLNDLHRRRIFCKALTGKSSSLYRKITWPRNPISW